MKTNPRECIKFDPDKLAPGQTKILKFIKDYIIAWSVPPTIREISSYTGTNNTWPVRKALNVLQRKGYIKRMKGAARFMVVTEKGMAV